MALSEMGNSLSESEASAEKMSAEASLSAVVRAKPLSVTEMEVVAKRLRRHIISMIGKAGSETGAIVTAEDHLEHGGLGSAVAQVVIRHRPVPMEFVAIKDTYAKSGSATELLQRYGLTAKDIEQAVRKAIKKRQG